MIRILVTRPEEQADGRAELLRERGIEPVLVPTVAIDATTSAPAIDAMLDGIDGAAWLVLTSANGAAALVDRRAATGAGLGDVRVAAVGPATAAVLSAAGIRVDHVPDRYRTVAIADGLGDVAGRRIILARADGATPELRDALLAGGAIVEDVVAYRTVEGPATSRDRLAAALHDGLSGVALTSSSTVRGLMRLASRLDRRRARGLPAFCIGPVTAATARGLGFRVAAVAPEHTAAGLADAIATHLLPEDQ